MENIFTLQKRATLAKILRDAGTIGIIASERQNFDTMGSALGPMLALKASKKQTTVVSSKDPLVEISNLYGIDKVKKSFNSSIKQLTISFPYVEGEIEKAMYKTEGNKINVHFYATKDKTITFDEKNVDFIKKGGAPDVVFAIAVSDDEIADFIDDKENVKLVRISRHPKDTTGDVVYQNTDFSSVAEIVTKIIQEQGLSMDSDAAQNLLDGIIFSTHNYTHQKTSPFAFEATGFLLKKGAQRREIDESKEEKIENTSAEEGEIQQFEPQEEQATIEKESLGEEQNTQEQDKAQAPEQKKTNGAKKEAQTESEEAKEDGEEDVPSDWFEPKVFRSSKSK